MATAGVPGTSRAEIARQPLERERAALVVVDIQQKLLPPIHEGQRLVRNARLLLHLAKILGLPVLMTTQYAPGLGPTVKEIAELAPDVEPIDKLKFGCFGEERFAQALKSLPGRRNTVLLCGMETHICVMQTALGALQQGYLVHVASDAVGSRSAWNWKVGLERMREAGALISSTEMMIYELLGGSGTREFKEMLGHLK